MKTKIGLTTTICLLLVLFVACKKDNENGGGNSVNGHQTEGCLTGVFSVGNGKQVHFSQGNLQYQASTDTWRFAEHQYDCIGSTNSNISLFYQGWVDLFGWGTSGDWGLNNAISNGGNKAGLWHLLTIDEWGYIVHSRNGSRFAKATVNNVRGLLLLPDGWSTATYALNAINDAQGGYESNYISATDWSDILEANGVVFLPCAGIREGNTVNYVNGFGRYWSSTYIEKARSLFIHQSDVRPEGADYHWGLAVRLVQDVK